MHINIARMYMSFDAECYLKRSYCILLLLLFAGFVYGAKENKMLQVFIDDLNLPTPDEHGVQRCNEVSTFIVVYHKFTM